MKKQNYLHRFRMGKLNHQKKKKKSPEGQMVVYFVEVFSLPIEEIRMIEQTAILSFMCYVTPEMFYLGKVPFSVSPHDFEMSPLILTKNVHYKHHSVASY